MDNYPQILNPDTYTNIGFNVESRTEAEKSAFTKAFEILEEREGNDE